MVAESWYCHSCGNDFDVESRLSESDESISCGVCGSSFVEKLSLEAQLSRQLGTGDAYEEEEEGEEEYADDFEADVYLNLAYMNLFGATDQSADSSGSPAAPQSMGMTPEALAALPVVTLTAAQARPAASLLAHAA